jgi:hypothetical protein
MAQAGVQVKPESLRSFKQACLRTDSETDQAVQISLKKAGELIRAGAAARTAPIHALSAVGYQSHVRSGSVVVRQRLPRTTGRHPEWGSWQMRNALLPAVQANLPRINREFEQATGKVCDRFEKGN